MVEDRITDGERIADVFRAEIDGRETGGLDRLSIAEDNGMVTVLIDDDRLAVLEAKEQTLDIRFRRAGAMAGTAAREVGLETRSTDEGETVVVTSAAETKRAVDVLASVAAEIE